MPAQNVSPSPRTRTTRTPGSAAPRSAASPRSANIWAFIALRLSGRFSEMVASPSWMS